jgi:hypothetical protein
MAIHKKNIKLLEQFEKKISDKPQQNNSQTSGNTGKPRPTK